MSDGFTDYIQQMQQGQVTTSHEFSCPLCGGTVHLQAGTLSSRPADWLWMEAWCEDCQHVEKWDGVQPWTNYELLLQSDVERYTLTENRQRIKRFAVKGCTLQALRLYRMLYDVDIRQANSAVEQLLREE